MTTGEVEIEGETLAVDNDDNDVPNKTKSIFIIEKELIKKLIKDDGLLKDSLPGTIFSLPLQQHLQ
jgi:hypothetical protein